MWRLRPSSSSSLSICTHAPRSTPSPSYSHCSSSIPISFVTILIIACTCFIQTYTVQAQIWSMQLTALDPAHWILNVSSNSGSVSSNGWSGSSNFIFTPTATVVQLTADPGFTNDDILIGDYFYSPGIMVSNTTTDLPSFVQSIVDPILNDGLREDVVVRLSEANNTYMYFPYSAKPFAQFIATTFTCPLFTPGVFYQDRILKCTASTTGSYSLTLASGLTVGSNGYMFPMTLTMEFFGSDSDLQSIELKREVYQLLFYKMQSFVSSQEVIDSTGEGNAHRRYLNRIAVGFLWCFAALVMLFICLMTATFQTWLYPLFPMKYAVYIWSLLIIGLTIGVSVGTGIAGFLILLFIYGFYSLGIGIWYYIERLRHRETPPSNDENTQEQKRQLIAKQKSKNALNNNAKINGVASPRREKPPPMFPLTRMKSRAAVGEDDQFDMDESDIKNRFTVKPARMGFIQRRYLGLSSMLFLTCFVLCVALFGIWRVQDYTVISRMENLPYQPRSVEYIPQTIAKSIASIYAFDGYANKLHLDNFFFHIGTEWCGVHYSMYLATVDDRYQAIELGYIEKYQVNMALFLKPYYWNYTSVNDWFIREINPIYRPIAMGADEIVSPADSRVTVWNNNPYGVEFYIKGTGFTMDEFLSARGGASLYDAGTLVIFRLAPQDYHRFTAPFDCTLVDIFQIEGSLHSVNADGMTSKNYAIYNQRTVMIFDSQVVGRFAYVAVGALCVGSVSVHGPNDDNTPAPPGTAYAKGDRIGYFQFGGSTIVLAFQPNKIRFDDELFFASQRKVETFLEVNSRFALATSPTTNPNLIPSRR